MLQQKWIEKFYIDNPTNRRLNRVGKSYKKWSFVDSSGKAKFNKVSHQPRREIQLATGLLSLPGHMHTTPHRGRGIKYGLMPIKRNFFNKINNNRFFKTMGGSTMPISHNFFRSEQDQNFIQPRSMVPSQGGGSYVVHQFKKKKHQF